MAITPTTAARFKVGLLAIGTEVTDGQIVNRNTAWLAEKMTALGAEVAEHRSVADDREPILRALGDLVARNEIVFVTGGLGPTSDDFTRECVAEFLQRPLVWHQASFDKIEARLKSRGVPVTENQRRQSHFPEGAEVLANRAGTADAFLLALEDSRWSSARWLTALPGPPSEIEAVWSDGLEARMKAVLPPVTRKLRLLRSMGRGEGMIGDFLEPLIDRLTGESGLERPVVGYRAHIPYVEIKLWSEDTAGEELVDRIATELRSWLGDFFVNEGKLDLADQVLDVLGSSRLLIVDEVLRGDLVRRLNERAAERATDRILPVVSVVGAEGSDVISLAHALEAKRVLRIARVPSGPLVDADSSLELEWLALGAGNGLDRMSVRVTLPKLAGAVDGVRGRKWAVEMILKAWPGRSEARAT